MEEKQKDGRNFEGRIKKNIRKNEGRRKTKTIKNGRIREIRINEIR